MQKISRGGASLHSLKYGNRATMAVQSLINDLQQSSNPDQWVFIWGNGSYIFSFQSIQDPYWSLPSASSFSLDLEIPMSNEAQSVLLVIAYRQT